VERVSKELGLFRTDDTPDPAFSSTLELDMSTVEPSLAGPKRPQDRIRMVDMRAAFQRDLPGLVPAGFSLPSREEAEGEGEERPGESWAGEGGNEPVRVAGKLEVAKGRAVTVQHDGVGVEIRDGTIVIAAITSCTNTSNPSVMVGAGLLAKKAVERGLEVPSWVKTSLAPGSKVVTDYLTSAGLLEPLGKLNFQVVGYGCTTCIGNSGPLSQSIHEAVVEHGLVVTSVLSGNRNFEARIHPLVRANYLASPMLVVAYALAGRVDIDMYNEPLGRDREGKPVFLTDVWPSQAEIRETVDSALEPRMFEQRYGEVFEGDDNWRALLLPEESSLYAWDATSTYVQRPPFFDGMTTVVPPVSDILGARVLALLGQSVTTDHISPAGAIPKSEPAGMYLRGRGVEVKDFNTFGSRRGNHEVMMRGTFGNVRMRNLLLEGKEGGYTVHFPTGEEIAIFEASRRYQGAGTPLLVVAGREYGAGSSRDWAAKGTVLLGVRAVLAESFERIHRSNLVGMGVLPLEFVDGQTPRNLGLSGRETYDVTGIADGLEPGCTVDLRAVADDGSETTFRARVRLDSDVDVEYYLNGGILQTVLRRMARGEM